MTDEKPAEDIRQLEIRARNIQRRHGESIMGRALDKEYRLLINQLKEAYQTRDGPKTLDEFGANLTDRERVEILTDVVSELESARDYIASQFLNPQVDPY